MSEKIEMTHCRICNEDIRVGARKCVHCDSYQVWWRGLFNLSALILSLLVALISVFTTAYPTIVSLLTPDKTKIKYALLECEADFINMVVVNEGENIGYLNAAKYESIEKKKVTPGHPVTISWPTQTPPGLKTKEPVPVTLKPTSSGKFPQADSDDECSIVVSISVLDLVGNEIRWVEPNESCSCPKL